MYIIKHIMISTGIHTFKKKIFVIDLINFPYIESYIDYRDQNIVNKDSDQISTDIKNNWNNYKDGYVMVVLVNLHKPYTALKLINTSNYKIKVKFN